MNDSYLIKRFQNGEKEAFDELVNKHYQETCNLFIRLSGNRMDANDLCQETFIRVYRYIKKFKFESKFSTWLYRIAINVFKSYHRKLKIRKVFSFEEQAELAIVKDEENPREIDPELWNAINTLPNKQKMIITLRIFQELPFKDVSAILNISENSAKVNYHHAIKNLRKKVQD
ncbi:MAG: hypothetical protein CMG75_10430 [Candidatus Marinimicrobia bacterium]|nr:hypothetical protein [Candidatus Neomarinimicrobiota bacterium]|tara:strand:+ start:21293 stop:21811 length:519 start_codon:yes stop_codon:yes gene_type:complete